MDCKSVQRCIPSFLAGELKGKTLIRFSEHMEKCEECKEELTIQYLSSEGIARLEQGKTFELDRELTEYMNGAIKRQNRRKYLILGIFGMEILALIIIAAVYTYALW